MTVSFDGKVVLVTGGTRGLGRAFSECAANAGATVILNSTTDDDGGTAQAINDAGGKAIHMSGLVEEPDALIEKILIECGRIDAIIHNAGFVRDKTLRKMSDQQWDEVMGVHLTASFRLSRAVWPHFEEQGGGRIVLISSASGLYGNFGQANYAAAKIGMYGLARSIAWEGGRTNITCNCVCPVGATTMNSANWSGEDKRIRKAEYVAPLVVYLAHEDCQESGTIFEASAGSFKKLRWERTEGLNVYPEQDTLDINTIAENWDKITDFSESEHPLHMGDSLERMYARFK
ncbi:MAG: SDR family NAD(P)-dependent oxidoreductase [Pseudomonadales bacterium]|nr:SDR family NAD(P)-dependent oxidoreductase [Pseudomonadales bacterium]